MSAMEKVALGGMLAIWIPAKIHTWSTWRSGHYIEGHWPFWAAMVAWALVAGLGLAVERWRKPPRSRS